MNAVQPLPAGLARLEACMEDVLRTAATEGVSPLAVLDRDARFEPGELVEALAEMFAYVPAGLSRLDRLEPAFDLLPLAEAQRRACLLGRQGGRLMAVITDPFDRDVRPWIEARLEETPEWLLTSRAELEACLGHHERSMRAMDSALTGGEAIASAEDLPSLTLGSITRDTSRTIRLVNSTVFDALRSGASDLHFETTATGMAVRYRIDGVLVNVAQVAGVDAAEQVISRIKVMSELDIAERRVPQDGRFKLMVEGRPIDFRVSVMPSVYGEDAVVRVLDKTAITDELNGLRLDSLGFAPEVVQGLRGLSARPYGMLLVTGPTGSGKTTTLYAAISEINTGADKIVTIEDPVEYQLPGVLQIPVNEKKGLTFARGLRSILRHDPDRIMVGEIRDPETAQIAIQSALTGHLVFTTVHANNVFDVLSRFMHMGVDPYGFVSALNGILAQRLLRLVCPDCAVTRRPAAADLQRSGIDLSGGPRAKFKVGEGCAACRGTGYRGRKAIGELLVLDDALREAIVARAPARELKELAARNGVRLIREAAVDMMRQGLTTLEEVNRVTSMA